MKLCWMFALFLALTFGARGNPQGMGESSELKGESDSSELKDMELQAYTGGSDLDNSDDKLSTHEARSLYDYVPEFGKNAITAVRNSLPVNECTKGDGSYSCCAVVIGPPTSKYCLQMEVDLNRLELKGGLVVNEKKLGGWVWEAGKMCKGAFLAKTCVHVYYLEWDREKKEVNVCVQISWMSVVNIDYGCFHFDIENGFRKIKLEKSEATGLLKLSWDDGKAQIDIWKPKGIKESMSNMASILTGETFKFGDWNKPKKN